MNKLQAAATKRAKRIVYNLIESYFAKMELDLENPEDAEVDKILARIQARYYIGPEQR